MILIALTNFQKTCYGWFGQLTEEKVTGNLKKHLQSAHIELRAGAYLAVVMFSALVGFVATAVFMFLFVFLLLPSADIHLNGVLAMFFLLIPVVVGILIYYISLMLPASRAKARAKKIDINLAYALNFISAMSSAGVTPTEIFKSLSKQDTYGEIKEEASCIYRDVSVLGVDILTAIRNNIVRTPSQKFKEFLQGLVVTVTSGGSLKTYFMAKADQYMLENRQSQKQLMESLGVMAESYVTTAVAGILLLLIVIPLMMIISGDWNGMFLYVLIFVIVPLIHGGFSVVIKSMSQTV